MFHVVKNKQEGIMFSLKNKSQIFLIIFILLFFSITCFSQTKRETKQWQKYQKKFNELHWTDYDEKIEIIKKFLKKYPGHFYTTVANDIIFEINIYKLMDDVVSFSRRKAAQDPIKEKLINFGKQL